MSPQSPPASQPGIEAALQAQLGPEAVKRAQDAVPAKPSLFSLAQQMTEQHAQGVQQHRANMEAGLQMVQQAAHRPSQHPIEIASLGLDGDLRAAFDQYQGYPQHQMLFVQLQTMRYMSVTARAFDKLVNALIANGTIQMQPAEGNGQPQA